jgi:hypothetical protein
VSLLIALLPGISGGQCPTSFTGKLQSEDAYTSICGFRQISAAIDLDPGTSFSASFGGMDVNFSNNVKIYSVVSNISNISVSWSAYEVNITFGAPGCTPAVIDDNYSLVTIYFTLISGNSATAVTSNTRLAYNCAPPVSCGFGSNASATTINSTAYELHGNLLIPSQFTCSGGSSTDHGLPNRNVTIEMAYSPYYEICDIASTNGFGYYECEDLRVGCEYNICINSDDDLCGIDEFDLDIIRDWIFGNFYCWDYEWQIFAADVSNNGVVTAYDLTQLRHYMENDPPWDIPLPWKYISNTQYNIWDEYLCGGDPYFPVVDNCSSITANSNPIEEDWYGFPTGDVNYSCTTCGFKGNPQLYTRSIDSKRLFIEQFGNKFVTLSFKHNDFINVWSLVLKSALPIRLIKNIELLNCHSDEYTISLDGENNLIKIIYTGLTTNRQSEFKLVLEFVNQISLINNSWSIYREDKRIRNILIDKNKNYYYWDELIEIKNNELNVFPNPANDKLYFLGAFDKEMDVVIYQLDGKLVLFTHIAENHLNISQLLPGTYFLRYKLGENTALIRFTKI